MSDAIDELENRFGAGPVIVQIRQDVKRGGELVATYEMEYPSLRETLAATSADLRDGRVEAISIGGKALSVEELDDLAGEAGAAKR